MVGDGHVFVAALPGSLGHFFDRVAAVGFDGVHVDVTLQVFLGDQLRQGMTLRKVDLAQVFAHLRRDVVELQLGVDLFLGFSRNRFLAFQRGEAIFVQGVSHLEGALAQGDVVRLGAREVLHGGAEGVGRKQANIDLHAATEVKANFIVSASDDIHDGRIFGDIIDGFLASSFGAAGLAGDKDVEVADGVAASAQGSGGRDFVDTLELLDVGGEFFALDLGDVDEEAAADAAIIFDGFDELGLVLLAHAWKFADFSFAGKFLHTIDVTDLVGAPDQRDGLWAEALNL